ncbi:MAG: hypothetical protein M0Q51_08325 [Bacteroidales bacterium]|nr:hypothetical protein [Bacteroidales bacterium]
MPIGQSHTVWFEELKLLLKEKWNDSLSISEQLFLVSELNTKLNQIRKEKNIKPPMMWCPECQKHTQSKFSPVSITGMYWALKRFEICSESEFKRLVKSWETYSKEEKVDIYGQQINLEAIDGKASYIKHKA